MMKKKKNNKGFSLVELIVVIAIMAVLVGVLAPQFIGYVNNSRISTDIQNVEEMKNAYDVYMAEQGTVSDIAELVASDQKSITIPDDVAKAAGIKATYIFKATWTNPSVTYDVDGGGWKVTGTATGKSKTYNLDGSN